MNLYQLTNGLGDYYVIATDPTAAEQKLMTVLNDEDGYGFFKDRQVKKWHLIAEEIDIRQKPFHLTNKFLLP